MSQPIGRRVRRLAGLLVAASGLLTACAEPVAPAPAADLEIRVLRETSPRDLAKILIPFLIDASAPSVESALPIRWSVDGYPHLTEEEERDQVVEADDGFTILFEIRRDLDPETLWTARTPRLGWVWRTHHSGGAEGGYWRSVECYPGKGETNFEEARVFPLHFATSDTRWFSVGIQVWDAPDQRKTVGDLLALLRKHYGTYRRLCRDVAEHLSGE